MTHILSETKQILPTQKRTNSKNMSTYPLYCFYSLMALL